jgi:hypothetical protein
VRRRTSFFDKSKEFRGKNRRRIGKYPQDIMLFAGLDARFRCNWAVGDRMAADFWVVGECGSGMSVFAGRPLSAVSRSTEFNSSHPFSVCELTLGSRSLSKLGPFALLIGD